MWKDFFALLCLLDTYIHTYVHQKNKKILFLFPCYFSRYLGEDLSWEKNQLLNLRLQLQRVE